MKIVRITSKKDGFRRLGVAHPETATDHPADRFKKSELEILKAESMLVVQELEVPDEKKDKAGK